MLTLKKFFKKYKAVMRLLIIEDDLILSDLLVNYLLKSYLVDLTTNLHKIENLFDQKSYQAILLSSHVFYSQELKKRAGRVFAKTQAPVLLLTNGQISQQDFGFLGQRLIDFLHKPFGSDELNLRLGVILFNLSGEKQETCLRYKNLLLDNRSHCLVCGKKSVSLTKKEFYLLQLFFKRPKQVFSKSLLANLVWDDEEVIYGNTIATHLSSLRKKIKSISGQDLIKTARGEGYFLSD
ncbi:response regulator transcription factor [Candidatus Woesebacteria bacterium]|jgi:DNA-binding response OmpR family regulator|nr:response regulator transcription factor [Candidatus Woesebacteria bacterium]HNV45015.1 response regulator transcription factor [Candidatus Woesebacteria bacterium]HQL10792.1 response regulator transcription factor [Candidatus Woesebacteria bacterium]HQO51663.1 response regulator transcription factor [Candidatus Woesebacteria bacterium]